MSDDYSKLLNDLMGKAGISKPVDESNSNTDFGSYEFKNISGMLEGFSRVTAKEVSKGKNREDKDVYVIEFDSTMGPQGVVINDLGFEPKAGMKVIHDGDSGMGGDKTVSFYDKEGALLLMAEQHNAGDWKKLNTEEIKKYIPSYASGVEKENIHLSSGVENKSAESTKKEPQTDKEIILDLLEKRKNLPLSGEGDKEFDKLILKNINILSNDEIFNAKKLGIESCTSEDINFDILKNKVKKVQQNIIAEQVSKKNR